MVQLNRQEHFLTHSECENLIDAFWIKRNDSYINPKNEGNRILDIGEGSPIDDPDLIRVWNKLNHANVMAGIEVHWAQIYEWDVGSKMGYHLDYASKHTVHTSVIYLNDDFQGGKTIFQDSEDSIPKQGTAIFYDGCAHIHGVSEVMGNRRYTLAAWYRNII